MPFIKVVLPIPVVRIFDYLAPDNIVPPIGGRVLVPFGQRQIIGIVIALTDHSKVALTYLKPITDIVDNESLFSSNLWRTLVWAITYYHHPPGAVLFHTLPVLLRQGEPIKKTPLQEWFITEKGQSVSLDSLNGLPKQKKALKALCQKSIYHHQICELKLAKSNITSLRDKGLCNFRFIEKDGCDWSSDFQVNNKNFQFQLNAEQSKAIHAICSVEKKFFVWLLVGVTGSGKTEVYLKVLETILSKGQQALVLVPEIGLIPQTISRFRKRFNVLIEVLHSGLSDSKRLSVWKHARYGQCAIVIGTRSALFTSFFQLGMIIVDEEHDSSYKQHVGWRYHARDLAVFRAREENIPIVLGTATPSLEALYNVYKRKYRQLTLGKRVGSAKLPMQKLIDIKGLELTCGLSVLLLKKMRMHLSQGNQVMLFLNRRGFSPILLCHECGWIAKCLRCDLNHILHQHCRQLRCHNCSTHQSLPFSCLQCGSTQLVAFGVGTEQLEIGLSSLFPNIEITRIDRDTTARQNSLENFLVNIKRGGARILIGTQMLAKGHHFPDVTLVALLEVDGVLCSSDFRATERFAQLYTQVAGRAGRAKKLGEVLLQTYYPEHPFLKMLLDYGYMQCAQEILKERREVGLPPFTKNILFRADSYDDYQAGLFLEQLRQVLINSSLFDNTLWFIGPTPALPPKRRGLFRYQLFLFHPSRIRLQRLISINLPKIRALPLGNKVKWSLDIDPIDI
ncbi:replication restart DNA helicase PriA [secondary endosymbiont of Heteropsylla cubana]|uniref:Replication restart protein PriA n=1 Tax=secondary endosymbiont of Heteropsylla cubana TaxID=134287 RepID=J3VU63_9ENTR|nr:primosomal protein N' [secondary endosymbiont of Heteropsylla cubana]AFP85646.1 replication restart DNA helicase PriA [secondary endosymbiont of Heteropsylla cubana]